MSISILYEIVGTGWSRCTVEAEGVKVELSASYLSDALGNLVLSAIAAISGFHSCSFGFDEEPGEYRWVIQAIDVNTVKVEVLEFPELWSQKANVEGKVLFTFICAPLIFAKAVHAAALAVLNEHGISGYSEKWVEYPFPERQLAILGETIAAYE